MPTDPKKVSKEEVQRRLQIEKDAELKKQRNFSRGAGAGKRKVGYDSGGSVYAKKENTVNPIKPTGLYQPKAEATPLSRLGRREIDSEGTFRKSDTNPIMKYVGGK